MVGRRPLRASPDGEGSHKLHSLITSSAPHANEAGFCWQVMGFHLTYLRK